MANASYTKGCLFLLILLLLVAPTPGWCERKVYWHFTFKAFLDKRDPAKAEWVWVTMVEYPKSRAYPEQARIFRQAGGDISKMGTIFAFVRGVAWRSAYRYSPENKILCGRYKDHWESWEVYWEESWSNSLYPVGQLNNPYWITIPGSEERFHVENEFRIGFTTRPVLLENGQWLNPKDQVGVFTGHIRRPDEPPIAMSRGFSIRPVNYINPLRYIQRCGKTQAKQYHSAFEQLHLVDTLKEGDQAFGVVPYGPKTKDLSIVYHVIRSNSREHPNWRQKRM